MSSSALGRLTANIPIYFWFLIGVVTLGPHQFGFHLAELNAPQDVITCQHGGISSNTKPGENFPSCIPMSEATFATVSSIFTIGGMIGALAAGPICSKAGRLVAMQITSLIFCVASTIETLSSCPATLGVGRTLSGIGAGASTVIVPLYISEIAPVASRGFFGSFTQITVNIGILFTQTLGYFLSHGNAWRWILGVGIILSIVHFFGLMLAPESPAWLAANKGEVSKARRILQRIRGKNVNVDEEVLAWPVGIRGLSPTLPAEEQGLLDQANAADNASNSVSSVAGLPPTPKSDSIAGISGNGSSSANNGSRSASRNSYGNRSRNGPVSFFQVVRDPLYRPAIISVIGIMLAQQTCGINSVIMYSVSLLNGMLPISSGLLTIIISAANLVTTAACAPLPDRIGRKTCLLLSVVGQGCSSLTLAFSIVYGIKTLSAFSVLTFVAFYAVGLGPVPFILASELVGQEAVGATQSWALGVNYVATFLVAQFFPLINTALNNRFGGAGWVYFLFTGFAIASAMFIGIYVPETMGKKDADEVWGRTRHID